jgi:ATP-binding cassette subfamily F protein 3
VQAERSGDIVVETRDLALRFGERTLFSGLSLVVRNGERVVVAGPNGGGKTSLLRLLLGELQPSCGNVRLGAGVLPGYLSQQQESVDPRRTPLEEIRSEAALDETAARTYLHRFLFSGDEVFTRCGSLSFGQRSRLALAKLILRGVNLLVLDEPMNHLDIPSRERFEQALAGFGGTVIAVSHDRYFIRRCAGRLMLLEGGRLREAEPESV